MDTHGIPNGEKGAFACIDEKYIQDGLTKREYFAGLAMQGMLASGKFYSDLHGLKVDRISNSSVIIADELLKQLKEQ